VDLASSRFLAGQAG